MKLHLVEPRAAPVAPFTCDLFELDIESIPFVLSALWAKSQRYNWLTPEDAMLGRQMIAKQGAQLLMGCSDKIVTAIEQLYRLTDSVHNGTVYSYDGVGTIEDPYVYEPAIPVVPPIMAGIEPSVKYSLEKTVRLQDNFVNGNTYDDAPDSRNIRQQLEDLLQDANDDDELDAQKLARLAQILAVLA